MTTTNNKKEKTPQECLCGCGAATKGGRYVPGHDAKHKKALIDAALGGSKRAASKLEALGWSKFLDAKRVKLAKHEQVKQEPAPASQLEAEPRRRGGRRKRVEEAPTVAAEETPQTAPVETADPETTN